MAIVVNPSLFAITSGTTIVGTTLGTGTIPTAISYPVGTVAGDVVCLASLNTSNSVVVDDFTWTQTSFPGIGLFGLQACKFLTSDDISAGSIPMSASVSGFYALIVYRGSIATPIRRNSALNAASPATATGFTKNGTSKIVVAMGLGITGTLTGPAGFTTEASQSNSFIADQLSTSYTNGTNIQMTFPGSPQTFLTVFEIV